MRRKSWNVIISIGLAMNVFALLKKGINKEGKIIFN